MKRGKKDSEDEFYLSEDLNLTKKQKKFNNWIYSKFKSYLKGDILETGSGCGTFSEKIIKDFGGKICLTEIDKNFISLLKRKFKEKRVSVKKLDLGEEKDFKKIKSKFDTIYSSNVLEHIKDDVKALKLLRGMLKPNGRLILLVPCHKFLYSKIDVALGHYRRYSKKELNKKVKEAGFKIEKAFWFNLFAIPGRFLNGNVLKKEKIHEGSFKLFNQLVPFLRFFEEKVFRNIIGISRVMVLRK